MKTTDSAKLEQEHAHRARMVFRVWKRLERRTRKQIYDQENHGQHDDEGQQSPALTEVMNSLRYERERHPPKGQDA